MDYIGSKSKLNKWMFDIMSDISESKGTFLDACCGSGTVSQYAAKQGYRVYSNDLMYFPGIIANGSIGVSKDTLLQAKFHIDKINKLDPRNGFFYENFCNESKHKRLYFTANNARKIDAAREYIESINDNKLKDYLLYCGIEALSRVSNTTGVQAAFLKEYKLRAIQDYEIRQEIIVEGEVTSYNQDILELVSDNLLEYKLLYLDPPYNQRQYGPNYHLYETFAKYDDPDIHGMTGLRNWKEESKSMFCSKKTCLDFTKRIILSSMAEWNFISYNSDGIISKQDILNSFDGCLCFEKDYRRYRSDISENRKYNQTELIEMLFAIPNQSK